MIGGEMLSADVNLFAYAHRTDTARHQEYREWLEERLSGAEPFGVSEMVLSSFMRVVTNHRIFQEPTDPEEAVEFRSVVRAAPAALPLRPGPDTGRSSSISAAK
ncbi:MAG: PIN domain-containing protein [Candidatus Dormibacteria bacterium]